MTGFTIKRAAVFAIAAALAAPGAVAAQHVHIGVEDSQAFRASEDTPSLFGAPGSRTLTAALGARPRLSPLSFAQQAELLGADALHFPVYADPEPGRYARGAASGVTALRQAGLKVVDPDEPDPEAICFTLMTCLMQVDAWSRARPGHPPLMVVLDARAEPHPGRLGRAKAFVLNDSRPEAPTWNRLALEVETALPAARRAASLDGEPGKVTLVARGGRGEVPEGAPFFVAGADLQLLDAEATPAWALRPAARAADFLGVLGAGWDGDANARAARAAGARLIIVDAEAARTPPPAG
jgi:hypothetical protein